MTRSPNRLKTAVLLLGLVLLLCGRLDAQSLTEKGQEFWKEYQKAVELNDEKAILRMIKRNTEGARNVFDTYVDKLTGEHESKDRADAITLAEQMDNALRTKEYNYRIMYILNLSHDDRVARYKAWQAYFGGYKKYEEGKTNKNVYTLDDALKLFDTAIEALTKIDDKVLLCEVVFRKAMCQESLEDSYLACVEFKKSMDIMSELPYDHPDKAFVESQYNGYIQKGFDPTKPRDEGGAPAGKPGDGKGGADGEVVTPEGKVLKTAEIKRTETSESAVLKFAMMKDPADCVTPGFNSGFNPYLWPGSWYDAREAEIKKFEPFYSYYVTFYGKQVNILRDGGKFYMDIDAQEKTRQVIKATTKPSKFVLQDIEKGPDGKPLKYQYFLQATGQQEVQFGMEMNNSVVEVETISLRIRTGCYTKGKILGQKIQLYDDNSNGIFGDAYAMDSDYITHGEWRHLRPDAMLVGREKIARPYSTCTKIDDKWYALDIDNYGRNLTATEVEVATGTLDYSWSGETEPTYLVLHLIHEQHQFIFFNVAGHKGPVELPIGEYEIACGKIETKKKGQAKQIRIYHGKSDYIRVYEGEETKLAMGAPFTFTFETRTAGKDFTVDGKSVNVWGRNGELYTQFFDLVPQPMVSIRSKESKKVVIKGDKMRLASREDFYEDRFCQWHPMDYTYENKRAEELEARLEAKSIKYLGGPVTSEWQ